MSYEDFIDGSTQMYIIPRGCQNREEAITINLDSSLIPIKVAVYFPHEKYQVITDQILRERKINLGEYIKNTESWRKQF